LLAAVQARASMPAMVLSRLVGGVPLLAQYVDWNDPKSAASRAADWTAIAEAVEHIEDPLFGRNTAKHCAAIQQHLASQA